MQEFISKAQITEEAVDALCQNYVPCQPLPTALYDKYEVKRGLRNADGTGVLTGFTQIGSVLGYVIADGERSPMEGRLIYRGYDLLELIEGFTSENRFGFEEVAYLLLFGTLPTAEQLAAFNAALAYYRELPANFTEDMILRAPTRNIMTKLEQSVLALYSYDKNPEDSSLSNLLHQAIMLIARFPMIVANAHAVKRHYFDHKSLYLHRPDPDLSTAENFLRAVRKNKRFTEEEARVLDLCLVIHAEHGGGNNSAFACRVLSSSGTDTYSAISAAVGALKGPKHGGANIKVCEMFEDIKEHVSNWEDEGQVADYLTKLIRKEAGDGSGLIYGMGHAVYTKSDPRAVVLKDRARHLALVSGMMDEFSLMESIERLTPGIFAKERGLKKAMCANVDMYSGLVYRMLNIPEELFTGIFAIARIVGWCAHRIEEVTTCGRIIRPAYKAISAEQHYVNLSER